MPHLPRRFVTLAANRGRQLVPRPQRNATRWRRGFRAMARREEGEYSTYSTDEQRRQRAKDQARWLQNVAVEALERNQQPLAFPHETVGIAGRKLRQPSTVRDRKAAATPIADATEATSTTARAIAFGRA